MTDTSKREELTGNLDQITAAFAKHEGAPTWQDDPMGRDAAIRWHQRGFEDAMAVFEQAYTPTDDRFRYDDDGLHIYWADPVEGCWVAFRRVDCVGEEELPERRLPIPTEQACTPTACPQPCEHLSQEDAREGRACPEHPCTCPPTDDEQEALSDFLFTVYEHGTQPNALREADAILTFLRSRRTAQACTPTDDEREAEALWSLIDAERRGWTRMGSGNSVALAHAILAAGFRRTVQGEPLCLIRHPFTGRLCSNPAGSCDGHVCDIPAQGEPANVSGSPVADTSPVEVSVQGEPADAAVRAGAYVLDEGAMDAPEDYPLAYEAAMSTARDVLRAAAAVREGE